ncbi:MAG: hypothetical protein ABI678_23320 [Kofleriaceae bacterium]
MGERWRAVAILAVGMLGLALYAYPGFMSFDSGWQLHEARTGVYTDWHPPAMAALWRLVEHVIEGPFGMWLLQCAAFVVGVALLARHVLDRTAAACAGVACLWFPPIAVNLAVVWKDCQMVGYLALGAGLLLRRGWGAKLAGLAVLTLASAMRHNAPTMTLPIVVMLFEWRPTTRLRRYALATAAWLAITIVALGANLALTDQAAHPWHGSLALLDVAGTLRFSNDSDGELRDELAGAPFDQTEDLAHKIRAAYSPAFGIFKMVDLHLLHQPRTAAERAGIASAWRRIVAGHPRAYLWHRWRMFRETLGFGTHLNWVWYGVDTGISEAVPFHPTRLQQLFGDAALRMARTWVMAPWLYALAMIVLGVIAVRTRDRLALALAASALTSELALFFLAPTPDFRYSLWLVACVPVVAILMVGRRLSEGRVTAPP